MHIGIAGNIGSGKTTLTRMLSEHYGWTPKYESVTYNPYLEDYYKDISRWSFNLEIYFLEQRFGDVLEIDQEKYSEYFDVVFMEGGILHYFHDIDEFMKIMNSILKKGGRIICSDFHPFTKINDSLNFQTPTMSYFSTEIYEGEMAHARFYDEEIRKNMPKCSYRKYTISEILNSMIRNGFVIKQFDEHPSWVNENLPGEFTAIGIKD